MFLKCNETHLRNVFRKKKNGFPAIARVSLSVTTTLVVVRWAKQKRFFRHWPVKHFADGTFSPLEASLQPPWPSRAQMISLFFLSDWRRLGGWGNQTHSTISRKKKVAEVYYRKPP